MRRSALANLTVPALPAELDGAPITWDDWDIAPTMSHLPASCVMCAFDEPEAITMGVSEDRRRYSAIRCRRCQWTRIIARELKKLVTVNGAGLPQFGEWIVVWQSEPQLYAREGPRA